MYSAVAGPLGAEPQSVTLVFGGYVLNVGETNDLWRSETSLDPNTSMPVAMHTKVEAEGVTLETVLLKGGERRTGILQARTARTRTHATHAQPARA